MTTRCIIGRGPRGAVRYARWSRRGVSISRCQLLGGVVDHLLFDGEACLEPRRVVAGGEELRAGEHEVAFTHAFGRCAEVVAEFEFGLDRFVRDLGADQVIDYRKVDFTEHVREVDVVLELVGADYGTRSITALRPGGLLV